jgi:hypothetical protein
MVAVTTAEVTQPSPGVSLVRPVELAPGDRRQKVRGSVVALGVAAVPFLAVLWNLGARPWRTAVPGGYFANLYDLQARAFLRGDLAIRDGLLGIEAFRRDGHEFLYFGPLPALLRVPIFALTDAYDGRLTAISMLLAWITAAVFIALLTWRVRGVVAPDRPVERVDLVVTSAFIAITAGGSPLLLLAAMPWVYSEALLWAVAFVLGTIYAGIGVIEQPSRARVVGVAACVLGAVLSRPTAGWSSGLIATAIGVWLATGSRRVTTRHWAWPMVLAGLVPVAIGALINWAKFRHPFLIPFESQAWTELSARRREVLEAGGVDGLRFLPSTLLAYLRPDGVGVSRVFPYLSLPAAPARPVGGVLLDMSYRTPSLTATMPLHCVLAVIGCWQLWRRGAPSAVKGLRIPQLGSLTMAAGVLLVGYIAPRYVVEFLPFVALSGCVGLTGVLERRHRIPFRWQAAAGAAAAVLGAFGVVACFAIGVVTARVASAGSSLRDYLAAQQWVSDRTSGGFDGLVTIGDDVPTWSRAGGVHVIGDCSAVYYGTGEVYEPWVPVEIAGLTVRIDVGRARSGQGEPGSEHGTIDILRFPTSPERVIQLEFDGDGQYRMVLTGADPTADQASVWRRPAEGFPVNLWVSADLGDGGYLVASPGYLYTFVETRMMEADLSTEFAMVDEAVDARTASRLGVTVSVDPDPISGFCASLVDR